jgi:hypothetical protein
MQSPEEISKRLDDARADLMQAPEEASGPMSPVTAIRLDAKGTNRQWTGDFTYKVPTLADQIKIGAMKTAYLPMGSANDANAALLVEQICYLEVTLSKKPDWWKPMEFYDATPVSELYKEVTQYERRFHGEGEDAGEDEKGSGGVEEPDDDGGSDVGRKVQPPPKRSETLVSHGA